MKTGRGGVDFESRRASAVRAAQRANGSVEGFLVGRDTSQVQVGGGERSHKGEAGPPRSRHMPPFVLSSSFLTLLLLLLTPPPPPPPPPAPAPAPASPLPFPRLVSSLSGFTTFVSSTSSLCRPSLSPAGSS
eukprot:764280-Hanusia_phi.AAC.12